MLVALSACTASSSHLPSAKAATAPQTQPPSANGSISPSLAPTPTTAPTPPETSPPAHPTASPDASDGTTPPTTQTPTPAPTTTKRSTKTVGVPSGTKLKRHDGDMIVTRKGTVINGLEVRGSISVRAPDVVIQNTKVVGVRELKTGLVSSRSTGLVIRNSEIYSEHRNPSTNGIMGSNFTLDHVEIRNVVDQVHIHGAGNVTVKNSWLHSNTHFTNDPNWNGGPSHDDNIQIVSGSNISIINNRLSGSYNAAIMITQDDGSVSNVRIANNRIGNGGCSINIAPGKNKAAIANLKIQTNAFESNQRHKNCAVIAPSAYKSALSGNYWASSKEPTAMKYSN